MGMTAFDALKFVRQNFCGDLKQWEFLCSKPKPKLKFEPTWKLAALKNLGHKDKLFTEVFSEERVYLDTRFLEE